ncbi:MAG: DUF485 domain-containing protein [Syntrophales bacterium]
MKRRVDECSMRGMQNRPAMKGVFTMADRKQLDWAKIAQDESFIELHKTKTRFLFGWWVALTLFSFMLPLGAGYVPDLFRAKIIGKINFAYLFVIVQIVISMSMSVIYYNWANRVSDKMTEEFIKKVKRGD